VRDAQDRAVRMIGAMQDVTERERTETQLRDSEARLRGFVENSADVLWIVDAEGQGIEYLSPSYERIWGEKRERVMRDFGRWGELVHPDDRAGALRAMPRLLAGEALVTEDYRIVRPSDGEVRWIRDTGFPIRDKDGAVRRVGGIAQDITDIRRAEIALRESEAHLRLVMERIPQLVWTALGDSRWTWASPQWCAYTGLAEEACRGMGWLEAIHPEDRAATTGAWAAAQVAGLLDVEHRVRSADGAYRWFHTRATPFAHGAGAEAVEWFGTSTDVHEMRQLRDQQEVLVAELQHRTRNLITVVRAIASQTMAMTDTLPAFNAELSDRLEALARVQGLLSRAEREPITISVLLRMELNALGAELEAEAVRDRVALEGPEVSLRHSVVQTLALALHELATNARKYGALATEEGRLRVTWQVRETGDAKRHLALEWVEEGASRLSLDDSAQGSYGRGGYGRELIERALPYTLGAETRYELGETGVRCTIDLPLDARRDS
jgi:PAS domain S-box-containing protein